MSHPLVCLLQVKILSSLITAVLPGIVLTIFLALLPALLALLNKKVQKMVSETDVEFGVVRKYFAFQVGCIYMPLVVGRPQLLNIAVEDCSACFAASVIIRSGVWTAFCCSCAFFFITRTILLLRMHLGIMQTCGCLKHAAEAEHVLETGCTACQHLQR